MELKTTKDFWLFAKHYYNKVQIQTPADTMERNILKRAAGLELDNMSKLYKFNGDFAKELVTKTTFNPRIYEILQTNRYVFDIFGRWVFISVRTGSGNITETNKSAQVYIEAYVHYKNSKKGAWYAIPLGQDFPLEPNIAMEKVEPYAECGALPPETREIDIACAFNGLSYVLSGQPDLREYKPPTKEERLTRKERDRIIQQKGNEECIWVSWGWKKPKQFSDKEFYTKGHYWWCPIGKGKLVRDWRWRNGHYKSFSEK